MLSAKIAATLVGSQHIQWTCVGRSLDHTSLVGHVLMASSSSVARTKVG